MQAAICVFHQRFSTNTSPRWPSRSAIWPTTARSTPSPATVSGPKRAAAGVVMTDGRYATCALDRNGLRPTRYVITKDKLITLASEVGTSYYTQDEVLKKGRVVPDELFVVDTSNGRVWTSFEIDDDLKNRRTYKQWMDKHCTRIMPFEQMDDSQTGCREFADDQLKTYQKLFSYSFEELD